MGTMRGVRSAINQSSQKKIKYDKLNLMSYAVVYMYMPDDEEVNYATNCLNPFAIISNMFQYNYN
jgi:hypothetical protein